MPKIFLSYRRDDDPFAVDWIDHGLSKKFGRESIVRDIDTFPLGRDFRVVIEREVNTCDILLAIIGDRWLDMRYKEGEKFGQRRIDDPADFMRLEIEAALQCDIPVIPVLVGGALMPRDADLPKSLCELVFRGAAEVRAGLDRQTHLNRLISRIAYHIEGEQTDPGKEQSVESTSTLQSTYTNTIDMEFVLIPAGTFLMGTPRERLDAIAGGDADYRDLIEHEAPQHRVHISQPFYLGAYPVTQAQWQAVMGTNPSRFKGNPNHPVDQVSWFDVLAFLQKLNELEQGRDYQLPTEAQWEYACRAGTETPRYHEDVDAIAWYRTNRERQAGQTYPVGQKLPNAWGLHDMLGNVWEWCRDGKRVYTADTVTDPLGPTEVYACRVIRGGSWDSPPERVRVARAADRLSRHPSADKACYLGFRCAMSVPSK